MTAIFDQRALPNRRLQSPALPQWFASVGHAWQAMSPPASTTVNPTRFVRSATLGCVVELIADALYRPGPGGQRRVPSAGAIFPYMTMVLAREERPSAEPVWRLFHVTPDGRVLLLPFGRDALCQVAAELDEADGPGTAHVLMLTRPWMSIRKYGPRGYLYAALDAAHASTNLLGISLAAGPAQLRLAAGAEATAHLLGVAAPYHELFGTVSLQPRRPSHDVLVEQVEARQAVDSGRQFEAICWSLLGDFTRRDTDPSRPARLRPVVQVADRSGAVGTDEWPALSGRRRSAKRFRAVPLDQAVLDALRVTVTALGTELPVGLADDRVSPIQVSVFAPGLVTATPAMRAAFRPFARLAPGGGQGSPATLIAALMGQSHLVTAQAFVLVHADRRTLLDAGRRRFDDAVFRAGAAGQLIYLGAVRAGLGVSAVGGFEASTLKSLAAIPADHELIYVVALGVNDDSPQLVKPDRSEPAHAHGER